MSDVLLSWHHASSLLPPRCQTTIRKANRTAERQRLSVSLCADHWFVMRGQALWGVYLWRGSRYAHCILQHRHGQEPPSKHRYARFRADGFDDTYLKRRALHWAEGQPDVLPDLLQLVRAVG